MTQQEPVPGDPHIISIESMTIASAREAAAAARAAAAAAVTAAAAQQANRDIAVAGTLGGLTADVQTLKGMLSSNNDLTASHGAMLLEVRDLARATNGRVSVVEKMVQDHDALLALVAQAMHDRDAVARFLSSWRGKMAIAGASLGGLAAVAASIRMLVTP